jgi:hypothetical protein
VDVNDAELPGLRLGKKMRNQSVVYTEASKYIPS